MLTEAWSPIAQGKVNGDAVLERDRRRSWPVAGPGALRWHIQRGDIVFPKSMHRERMQQNFDLFDFELSDAQMAAIDGLDPGETGRLGPNPDQFD